MSIACAELGSSNGSRAGFWSMRIPSNAAARPPRRMLSLPQLGVDGGEHQRAIRIGFARSATALRTRHISHTLPDAAFPPPPPLT